jgi:hypothetical protein
MKIETEPFHPAKDVWYNLPRGFVKSFTEWELEESETIKGQGREGQVFSSTHTLFLVKDKTGEPVYRFKNFSHVVCVITGEHQCSPMAVVDQIIEKEPFLTNIAERDLFQRELVLHG